MGIGHPAPILGIIVSRLYGCIRIGNITRVLIQRPTYLPKMPNTIDTYLIIESNFLGLARNNYFKEPRDSWRESEQKHRRIETETNIGNFVTERFPSSNKGR